MSIHLIYDNVYSSAKIDDELFIGVEDHPLINNVIYFINGHKIRAIKRKYIPGVYSNQINISFAESKDYESDIWIISWKPLPLNLILPTNKFEIYIESNIKDIILAHKEDTAKKDAYQGDNIERNTNYSKLPNLSFSTPLVTKNYTDSEFISSTYGSVCGNYISTKKPRGYKNINHSETQSINNYKDPCKECKEWKWHLSSSNEFIID